MTLLVLWLIGFIFNLTFGEILVTSILLTAISFLGDVYLLPKIGRLLATVLDFVLAFAIIWIIGSTLYTSPISVESYALISAFILTILESVFHLFMKQEFFRPRSIDKQFQTEFAEEHDDGNQNK